MTNSIAITAQRNMEIIDEEFSKGLDQREKLTVDQLEEFTNNFNDWIDDYDSTFRGIYIESHGDYLCDFVVKKMSHSFTITNVKVLPAFRGAGVFSMFLGLLMSNACEKNRKIIVKDFDNMDLCAFLVKQRGFSICDPYTLGTTPVMKKLEKFIVENYSFRDNESRKQLYTYKHELVLKDHVNFAAYL